MRRIMTKRYGLTLRFRGSHSLSLFSGGVCVITLRQIALHPKATKLVQIACRKNRLTLHRLTLQLFGTSIEFPLSRRGVSGFKCYRICSREIETFPPYQAIQPISNYWARRLRYGSQKQSGEILCYFSLI